MCCYCTRGPLQSTFLINQSETCPDSSRLISINMMLTFNQLSNMCEYVVVLARRHLKEACLFLQTQQLLDREEKTACRDTSMD